MPFSPTKIFLEETSLVARPIVPFPELKARLDARLGQLGAEETHWRSQQSQLTEDEARWNLLLENSRSRSATARLCPHLCGKTGCFAAYCAD